MASYLISNLWEELKCPICLDFLTCAASIECGHNFCESCIQVLIIKTSKSRLQCPKCHKKCKKTIRLNRQLGTVAQSFKMLTLHMTRNWKLRDVIRRKFFEEILLDPEISCPGITVSRDMKTIRKDKWKRSLWKGSNLCGAVLATQSFKSGRHYWEVTVGNSSAWDIGLCKNSVKRKGAVAPSSSTGFWLLSLRQETYIVCTMPRMSIPIPRKLHKVGIFLDYEAGDIMFYDVDNRWLIYTFTSSFSEPLLPIFSIGLNSSNENVLTIEPVPKEAAETPEHA